MLRQVKVEQGIVEGLPAADPRITSFKGIPFAEPPVGDLRWAPPMPPKSWEGVKECYKFSKVPVEPLPSENPDPNDLYAKEWWVDPHIPCGEDCLYLNVWTPAKKADEKLPVYFWIFGGGFQIGNASEMEFDGERIARRGIVVVTINYRVNLFGFLCHPEISAQYPEQPANFGLLDQQAALKWVVKNIEAFGGNPDNITIGGQSAGAGSVLNQIQNRESRKLFKRAVVESGLFYSPGLQIFQKRTLQDAEQVGVEFFKFCGASNLSEAKKLSSEFLWKKWEEWGGWEKSIQSWLPLTDNHFIFNDFLEGVEKNAVDVPPLMIGHTPDEFIMPSAPGSKEMKRICEDGIKRLQKLQEDNKTSPENYYYLFDVPIPGYDNPGKFHSVDLWFFFETLAKCWRPFKGVHYDMARQICDYLCNFIKTGNPNGTDYCGEKLTEWEKYSTAENRCMSFSTECRMIKAEFPL